MPDRWAAASSYEAYMGRWSRMLARVYIGWLEIPTGARWLDVGCGTGALTGAICDLAHPSSVVGCDPSAAFIEFAKNHNRHANTSFVVAGAGNLPPTPDSYNCVASLVALNFIPDPEAAVAEMRALTTPAGVVSACVWDYAGRMEFLRRFWDAAVALNPAARALDEGVRFPLCSRDRLVTLFASAGLRDVRCEPIGIPTEFLDFDDYWRPFLGATGPAPSYVASLNEEERLALAGRIDRALPRGADGRIALTAGAWAVRGAARTSP